MPLITISSEFKMCLKFSSYSAAPKRWGQEFSLQNKEEIQWNFKLSIDQVQNSLFWCKYKEPMYF